MPVHTTTRTLTGTM